jgi:uncharacterized protein YjbI with pentapeptide repeats
MNILHFLKVNSIINRNSQCELCVGANLKSADLEGSQMFRVELRVASLKGARLRNCDLRRATLAGADLEVIHTVFTHYTPE